MYVVFGLVLLVASAVVAAPDGDHYSTKYDKVNLDDIIKNDRLFTSYFNCIMGKGKCTPDGEELKKHIPDALETDCSKCSDVQKAGAKKMLKYTFENKPDMYKELEAKFDPQGKYRKGYADFVKDA